MSFAKASTIFENKTEKHNRRIRLMVSIAVILPALVVLYLFLHPFAGYLVYDLAGLNAATRLGESVHFFVYDTLKILILLFLISSLMGVINAYFPVERLRVFLANKKLYGLQYFLASVFGAVTPFCSCSSIPLFIGFLNGGIPLGVTFSFLITSPLVNEVAFALFLGLFGVKATLIYAGSGILMGTAGGFLLGKLNLGRYLTDWGKHIQANAEKTSQHWDSGRTSFIDRLPGIIHEGWEIVRKVLVYVLAGIAIGAAMHGYVPENFFAGFLSAGDWYAVPLAVLFAVPVYANAAGIVPLVQVFVAKGVPLGTALAFMMAVTGLSVPEAILLKKVMKWKMIGIFFGLISLFIILLGYMFNLVL